MGGSEVGSDSGEAGLSDIEGSILPLGAIVREVKAFTGSERFSEKDVFSTQIAHWSFGKDQYFPRLSATCSCFSIVREVPKVY